MVIKEGQLPVCSRYLVYQEDYGLDVPMFSKPADILESLYPIQRLLENPASRIAKARELFEKTKKDFDFVNLYRELFEKLERDL